jgi:hypothetical protein
MRAMMCACVCVVSAGLAWGQPTNAGSPAPPRQSAAPAFSEGQVLPLWPSGAPGALGHEEADIPSVAVYRAPRPNGTAIIVFPGGARPHAPACRGRCRPVISGHVVSLLSPAPRQLPEQHLHRLVQLRIAPG